MKPTVKYIPDEDYVIREGYSAWVYPTDHPSDLVSNEQVAITSEVLSYDDKTGNFETKNTLYVLDDK